MPAMAWPVIMAVMYNRSVVNYNPVVMIIMTMNRSANMRPYCNLLCPGTSKCYYGNYCYQQHF
jgi:hypothetical protein